MSVEWIKNFLIFIKPYSNTRIGLMIDMYLMSSVYSSSYGFTFGYIERLLSFIIMNRFYAKLIKEYESNLIFINVFYLFSFIYLYGSEMVIVVQRISLLFLFSYWILYPKIYSFLSQRWKMLFLFFLLICASIKLHNKSVITYENILFGYTPYESQIKNLN
jgi:hypothetical protein